MEQIKLRKYQEKALDAIANHNGRQLLHMIMGSGKTLTALYLKKRYPAVGKTLIITCASIKLQWEREIRRLFPDARIYIIDGQYNKSKTTDILMNDWVIVNYDVLSRHSTTTGKKKADNYEWADILSRSGFQYLIVDESQKCANPSSNRTKAVQKIALETPYRVLLTGTAYTTKLSSLYSQLHILDPLRWDNYKEFERRYIPTHLERIKVRGGRSVMIKKELTPTEEQLRALHSAIQQDVFLVGRDEVYSELPPIQEVTVNCELHDNAFNHAVTILADKDMDNPEEVKRARELYSNLRMQMSKEKRKFAKEWLHDYLDSDESLLVICYYRETVEELYEEFKDNATMIYGGLSQKEKEVNIDKFIHNPECKFMFMCLDCCQGIDGLHKKTSKICFLDTDARYYQVSQALFRIQRVGSSATDKYIAYHIIADCPLDYAILNVRKKREAINNGAIEGKFEGTTYTDDVKAIVNELKTTKEPK